MPTPSVILDRKLRFAVVGCGRIAQSHFGAQRLRAGLEIAALDRDMRCPRERTGVGVGIDVLQYALIFAPNTQP